jgi:hypothetical protein
MNYQKFIKYQTKNKILEKKLVQVGGEKSSVAILKGINLIYGEMQPFLDPTFGFLYCESGLITSLYHYGPDDIKYYVNKLYTKHTDGVIRPTKKLYDSLDQGEVSMAKLIGQFVCHQYVSLNTTIRSLVDDTILADSRLAITGANEDVRKIDPAIAAEIKAKMSVIDKLKKDVEKQAKIDDILSALDQHIATTYSVEPVSEENTRMITLLEAQKNVFIAKQKDMKLRKLEGLLKFESLDKKKELLFPNKFKHESFYYYAVLGILWWIANNKESIKEYYEGVNDMLTQFAEYMPELNDLKIEIPPDFTTIEFTLEELKNETPTDYHQILAIIQRHKSGDVQLFNQEWLGTKCIPVTRFPDCGEVAVRNLLNILSYDDGTYDVEKLKVYGSDPPTETYAKVVSYYERFNTFTKQNTKEARNEWGHIMSNLAGVRYKHNCNDADGKKIEYEIIAGHDLDTSGAAEGECMGAGCGAGGESVPIPTKRGNRPNLLAVLSNLLPGIKNWSDFNTETVNCKPNLDASHHGTLEFVINEITYLLTIDPSHYSIHKENSVILQNLYKDLEEPERTFAYYLTNRIVTNNNELYWTSNITNNAIVTVFNKRPSILAKDEYNPVFRYLHGLNNADINSRLKISLELINFEKYDLSPFGITYNIDNNYSAENIKSMNLDSFYSYNSLNKYKFTILTHLELGKFFNQPLGDLLRDITSLTHLSIGQSIAPLGDSLNNIVNLTHLSIGSLRLPLGESLNALSNLTHLTFTKGFNHSLGSSLRKLSNLTHLTFNEDFNQPLDNSLHELTKLTHLTFSDPENIDNCFYSFNRPLNDSLMYLTSLTHLVLSCKFNIPLSTSLDNLINLTHLTFGDMFDQYLTNVLPKLRNLTHLALGKNYGSSIKKYSIFALLPKTNITHLVFNARDIGESNFKYLNRLTHLTIGRETSVNISKLNEMYPLLRLDYLS